MESQEKIIKWTQTDRERGQSDGCQKGGGWGLGETGNGFKTYKMLITKQSRGCEVQRKESSQYALITMCSARQVLAKPG